jgi:hypothetical protein
MRRNIWILALSILALSCKKGHSDLEVTPTLNVEQRNMGVFAVRTATWCGPCGSHLDNTQSAFENVKGSAVAMAFKDAFSEAQSPFADVLFDKLPGMFEIATSVPTLFQNFNAAAPATIAEHLESEVILNGNYEIIFNGNEMTINTTTKFFKEYLGDVYLAPFIIVDSLVGYQNQHPNSPQTVHMKYVADVAFPSSRTSGSKYEWGYLVSTGVVKKGHQVNLQFKAEKRDHWKNHNISVGMVYFRKMGEKFIFLNAFTK